MNIHQHTITITLHVATITNKKIADTTKDLADRVGELSRIAVDSLGHHLTNTAVTINKLEVISTSDAPIKT